MHYVVNARRGRRVPLVRHIFLVCALFISALLAIIPLTNTHASDQSWIGTTLATELLPKDSVNLNNMAQCHHEQLGVAGFSGKQDVCVYSAKDYRWGQFEVYNGGSDYRYNAIQFPGDEYMHVIDDFYGGTGSGITINNLWISPDSNDISFIQWGTAWTIKDVRAYLELSTTPQHYHIKPEAYHYLSNDENGASNLAYIGAVSDNGKWMVLTYSSAGLVRINLDTFEVKLFSQQDFGGGSQYTLDISNDGRHIVSLVPNWYPPTLFEITDDCGENATILQSSWKTNGNSIQHPCASRNLTSELGALAEPKGGYINGSANTINFDYNGDLYLNLTADSSNPTQYAAHIADQFDTTPKLDYLAVGDSYSSGEGDTMLDETGHKYYRPHTDVEENPSQGQPREKCHLSIHSYPYLLAQDMGLALDSPKQWDSIACSGANSQDVASGDSRPYFGQFKGKAHFFSGDGKIPRLQGYDPVPLQTQALNEFIPGRIKQIEFIRKYRPKVITLTIGGNDVDFGGKIGDCLFNHIPFTNCTIATPEGRLNLSKEIKSQFDNLVSLYRYVQLASPSSKIYVFGYPEVISGDENNSNCDGDGIGGIEGINNYERHVINDSYHYFNQIVKDAAERVGIEYIDIENSLDGGKLCDLGTHREVTGLTGLGSNLKDETQETFHPNAAGHVAIAQAIRNALPYDAVTHTHYNLLTSPYDAQPSLTKQASNPEPTSTLPSPDSSQGSVKSRDITSTSSEKNTPTDIQLESYSLKPDSTVSAELHSDPVDLGTFMADSDGSLSGQITVPSTVPAGYHTLIITGQTYSGEPIKYEQVIFVYSDPNDIDEDGVPDSIDPCLFITPSGHDSDLDGVDDACDPYVDPTPRPVYRLRAGDPLRTYNGTAENPSTLYLERNIFASSITGVSGDYDPDGDGYAVIGTFTPSTSTGRLANFQKDTSAIPNILKLSFRSPENGCVAYTPDLSKVTLTNQTTRVLTQTATDTSSCRSQATNADADSNGQPDNTQALYIGRNGDASKGETATKLYLFRSTRGAEAQLGISDYASFASSIPSNVSVDDMTDYRQPWSLLASTQSAPTLPVTYRGVHMVGNVPYVVATTNTLGLCQAYKPGNVGTIRQSTQSTTGLTLDTVQTLNAVVQGWCN